MKIIIKTLFPIFLAIILVACNSVESTPTTTPMDVAKIAIAVAETGIAMTQTAIPTATFPPTVTLVSLTATPPEPTRIPPDSYADKIDYAMATAPKIYTRLPYINKATPYGEYSGCIKTYDFHNFVSYAVSLPMETVNAAFLNYFSSEKWDFTEATSELVGYDNNIPRTTYDVYRISSIDKPAFERLIVILTDESTPRGHDHIDVRAELTHVDTKENLEYLLYPLTCFNLQEGWLWIGLHK